MILSIYFLKEDYGIYKQVIYVYNKLLTVFTLGLTKAYACFSPRVELGTKTIVGTGSFVTKCFPEGFCVITGNPAKEIKHLDKDNFGPWYFRKNCIGIPEDKFKKETEKYIVVFDN